MHKKPGKNMHAARVDCMVGSVTHEAMARLGQENKDILAVSVPASSILSSNSKDRLCFEKGQVPSTAS